MGDSSNIDRLTLKILRELTVKRSFPRNSVVFIKYLLFRRDERLLFLMTRYRNNQLSTAKLLDDLVDLIDKESFKCFKQLYALHTLEVGKIKSKEERKEKKLNHTSLTYGEIDYGSFYRILTKCCRGHDPAIFYDLGSGTGRPVFAARFTHDFCRCDGVEILEGLYQSSIEVYREFQKSFTQYLRWNSNSDVNLYQGSVLDFDWSDGDIVFANSTCFDEKLMRALSSLAEKLKPGAIFISFTKALSSTKFELVEKTRYLMSWGPATVYIHVRRDENGISMRRGTFGKFEKSYDFERLRNVPLIAESEQATSTQARSNGMTNPASYKPLCSLPDLQSASPSDLVAGEHVGFFFSSPSTSSNSSSSGSRKGSSEVSAVKCLLRAPLRYEATNYSDLPLVVFLHGASARGSDFKALKEMALPKLLTHKTSTETTAEARATDSHPSSLNPWELPALVLCPLCPTGVEWKAAPMCSTLLALIDTVISNFAVDASRVYLTGISMGGLGSWMLAARNPHKFAAVVPMCGGGSPVYARLLKQVPMWFVHSEDDNVVSITDSDRLVETLRAEGSVDVQYSRFEKSPQPAAKEWMVGHNCWDVAYSNPELWRWLFAKSLEQTP